MIKSKINSKETARDICQTPGYGIEPLVAVVDLIDLKVWECASGEGILLDALQKYGADVFGTDLDMGFDFLACGVLDKVQAIITNPPFSIKDKFTERALQIRRKENCKIAFLMPSDVVSKKWFIELVQEYGEPGIIWFNPRINFKMPNKGWDGAGSHLDVAWFTWGWFVGNRYIRFDHWTKKYRKQFEK